MLCPFHHQVVIHRWGWTLVVNPDGTTTPGTNKTKVLHRRGPPGPRRVTARHGRGHRLPNPAVPAIPGRTTAVTGLHLAAGGVCSWAYA